MKLAFIIFLLLFGSSQAFSQLDSTQVNIEFVRDQNATDSTGTIKVKILLNDLDHFGTASVDIYKAIDNSHLVSIFVTKQDAIAQGFFLGNELTLAFEALLMSESYKIETTLQDQDLLYVTPIITIYNP